MADDSFSKLLNSFSSRVRELKSLLLLRNGGTLNVREGADVDKLREVSAMVSEVERELDALRSHVHHEKEVLNTIETEMKKKAQKQAEFVQSLQKALPSKIAAQFAPPPASSSSSSSQQHSEPSASRSRALSGASAPPQNASKPNPGPVSSGSSSSSSPDAISPYPRVQHIFAEELASVPQYMRGRITLERVNAAIDEINNFITTKYKILSTSLVKCPEKKQEQYKSWKDQETKETKGIYFFLDVDLKDSTNLKMDNNGKSILTSLRHLKRISEVRSSGFVRYAIPS